MGSFPVVVVGPRLQLQVSLLGVGPVFCISPFAQRGLDEAPGLAVGSGRVGSGAVVLDGHVLAGKTELARAVAGAVVGQQGAYGDAVSGEKLHGRVKEANRLK